MRSEARSWYVEALLRAAWAPAGLVLTYAVGVKATNAQWSLPWIDMAAHFLGGVAITYFFSEVMSQAQRATGKVVGVVRSIAALGLTALAAIGWELMEYASDALLGTSLNNGVTDTLMDLVLGIAGGLALLIWRGASRER